MAVEVDSHQWHMSPSDHDKTLQRQTRIGKYHIAVLRFTPRKIRTEPVEVLAAIREALESASGRPSLNLRTVSADAQGAGAA